MGLGFGQPTLPQTPTTTGGNLKQRGVNYIGNQSKDPYRTGLQTQFTGIYDPSRPAGAFNTYANDSDSDVRQAQELTNIMSQARYQGSKEGRGVDSAATQAQLDAVLARIGAKNALGESIGRNSSAERSAEDDLRFSANDALGSGLKNTRQNFNGRGLLYSGMRQGGESQVRSGVASNLASGLATTKRDYGNLKSQQQQAYASIGHAQQAAQLQAANEAFDSVSRNNIARAQAYQQLGQGLGGVAGALYSQYGGKSSGSSTPNAANDSSYNGAMIDDRSNDYWRTA